MKREFTNENFERFLKQSADNLRMKAPEKVWQNLSRELNKRRRRFVIGLGSFLLVTSAITYYTIADRSAEQETAYNQFKTPQTAGNKADTQENLTPSSTAELPVDQPSRGTQRSTNFSIEPIISDSRSSAGREVSLIDEISSGNIGIQPAAAITNESFVRNNLSSTIVDSYTEFDDIDSGKKQQTKQNDVIADKASLPLTIESVINSYRTKVKKAKLETQFYFAPTISYRKLSENKSYLRNADPSTVNQAYNTSVNNEVTHKPDIGFELGLAAKYTLSKKLKLRAGVQFNVNRYDVKAFSSYLSQATIALNSTSRIDSLNPYTQYSNKGGYQTNWLQNFSFQVSAPIGVELLLGGKSTDKMQFGIVGTIQPTYVLGDRAYLISTDYKNYALVPWLARRWNVNTALETFITYNTGKTKWQVGPQVRYQLLSSFIDKYPVKENLFDFGLKVGISLNK